MNIILLVLLIVIIIHSLLIRKILLENFRLNRRVVYIEAFANRFINKQSGFEDLPKELKDIYAIHRYAVDMLNEKKPEIDGIIFNEFNNDPIVHLMKKASDVGLKDYEKKLLLDLIKERKDKCNKK